MLKCLHTVFSDLNERNHEIFVKIYKSKQTQIYSLKNIFYNVKL